MTLEEFREEVYRHFGKRLERATPASVQDFLVHMQARLAGSEGRGESVELSETAQSYDQIVTEFFAHVLQATPDQMEQALMQLWLVGLELHYARIEEQYADKFARLFGTDLDG